MRSKLLHPITALTLAAATIIMPGCEQPRPSKEETSDALASGAEAVVQKCSSVLDRTSNDYVHTSHKGWGVINSSSGTQEGCGCSATGIDDEYLHCVHVAREETVESPDHFFSPDRPGGKRTEITVGDDKARFSGSDKSQFARAGIDADSNCRGTNLAVIGSAADCKSIMAQARNKLRLLWQRGMQQFSN